MPKSAHMASRTKTAKTMTLRIPSRLRTVPPPDTALLSSFIERDLPRHRRSPAAAYTAKPDMARERETGTSRTAFVPVIHSGPVRPPDAPPNI